MKIDTQIKAKHQKGAALVISLIILLVMTILGIQGMQSTTLEEKMAGNFRDRAIAFEAAEAGLAAGHAFLENRSIRPDPTVTPQVWNYGALDFTQESTWNNAIVDSVGVPSDDQQWSEAPRFFIEDRGLIPSTESKSGSAESGIDGAPPADVWSYRITAIGYGISPNSQVVLQANYEIVFNFN